MVVLFEILRNICFMIAGALAYTNNILYSVIFIFGSLPFDFMAYYFNKRSIIIPPSPVISSQWHWPDTPAYQEAYKREETELAKIRKEINRCFLYLGIALVFAVALITFGMVYYSIHK